MNNFIPYNFQSHITEKQFDIKKNQKIIEKSSALFKMTLSNHCSQYITSDKKKIITR